MLTLEARGHGASVILLTLNRGEGGQNRIGSDFSDVLGVLRTLEVSAADQYYGIDQRFTRVADFGFSKSPDETFQKWGGHDVPLADIVRVIRTFQPDVIVARFSGTSRDGHGHHQASSILSREAFHAAADPNRFPEQIKEGLHPWQAKKFYIGNVCGFGSNTCPDENWTVRLNTGDEDSLLGASYIQFALAGLRHQLSQGVGGFTAPPGPRYSFYKLVESLLPEDKKTSGHESDFFDGIDTSLAGLAMRLESEEPKVSFLKPALGKIQAEVSQASSSASQNASANAALLAAVHDLQKVLDKIQKSSLAPAIKASLDLELKTKLEQAQQAVALATDTSLQATAEVAEGSTPNNAYLAIPGSSFKVVTQLCSQQKITDAKITLEPPAGWKIQKLNGNSKSAMFEVTVPADAKYSRPYWHRTIPEKESVNTIDDSKYVTLPFPPPPLKARAEYAFNGQSSVVESLVTVKYKSGVQEGERALAVAPAFSVILKPANHVFPVAAQTSASVMVEVRATANNPPTGTLRLQIPVGWKAEPAELPVHLSTAGEIQQFEFQVTPGSAHQGDLQIRAILNAGGKQYGEGYIVVTRDDLGTFYYYQPATQRVSMVDVTVPKHLKVGYIMGAGDDIPTVLQQVGMNVNIIHPEKLANEDLSMYGSIIVGIRAYDTQNAVAANNKKLLDFVHDGGTLVVQYNADTNGFNNGHFTPYPAELSRARVSVEEAPVEILAPEDSIFHSPNQITQQDFEGWIQERGLYFMSEWDPQFKPLLSCHDPEEPDQKGGLMRAQYGKGTYIYTGYSFFRQLPAGVPGAVRLFVNLVSAGH